MTYSLGIAMSSVGFLGMVITFILVETFTREKDINNAKLLLKICTIVCSLGGMMVCFTL